MNNLVKWIFLARSMGLRYVVFRTFFEFRRRTGLLKFSFPRTPPMQTWISLATWREQAPAFFFDSREDIVISKNSSVGLQEKASRIVLGQLQFFHGEWKKSDPD